MKTKDFRDKNDDSAFLNMTKKMSLSCIAEADYAAQMEQTVEPYLREHGAFDNLGGLYYEFYGQLSPKGTIVVCFGFSESCEKFHELAYYMHREGYQVALWDHRGHGKSRREVENPQLIHVDHFFRYVKDMHRIINKVVLPKTQEMPLYLYAHSMGGCISTLYLEKYPGIFRKAVLSTPMYGIQSGVSDFAAWSFGQAAALLGKEKEKLFTMGDFDPWESFEDCGCDSEARHTYYQKLRRENKEYQTSAGTYGWLVGAINAGKGAVSTSNAAKITIPVLLFQATEDDYVRAKEQDLFLSRIPNGRKIIVNSRHEINRSGNETLEPYLAEIFEFMIDRG